MEFTLEEVDALAKQFGRALVIAALKKAGSLNEAREVCEYFTPGTPGCTGPKPKCLEEVAKEGSKCAANPKS